jgi:hypothetical protein
MCSSGLEALSVRLAQNFLETRTFDLPVHPAIATHTLLAGRCFFIANSIATKNQIDQRPNRIFD